MSIMAVRPNEGSGTVRRKYGNWLPLLKSGEMEEGPAIGTWKISATLAASVDATEHPVPMIAWTPAPPERCSRLRWFTPRNA
eukprot:3545502-Prymnesium_polylepis.1